MGSGQNGAVCRVALLCKTALSFSAACHCSTCVTQKAVCLLSILPTLQRASGLLLLLHCVCLLREARCKSCWSRTQCWSCQRGVWCDVQAVLQRKLVVPEVYDIMTRVQEMMVRSQSSPVRQLCSSVLLQFLLDYPVGDKRLQQHLHFIITNLSYQHETGREAAIDMLKVRALLCCAVLCCAC